MKNKIKVYVYYLILPKKEILYDHFDEDEIDTFFDFVSGTLQGLKYNEMEKSTAYLYGFTKDENLASIFKSIHDENLFIEKIKKMTPDEYEKFERDNLASKIINYPLENIMNDTEKEHMSLVCIKNEVEEIEYSLEVLYCQLVEEVSILPYKDFKEEYIIPLDMINFTELSKSLYYNEADEVYYNMSFCVSPENYFKDISTKIDYMNLYVKAFSLLLRKD